MAEAKEKGHDCIITIGGIQSNHARATVGVMPASRWHTGCPSPAPSCVAHNKCYHDCAAAAGSGGSLLGAGVPPHTAKQPPPSRLWWVGRVDCRP